LVDELLDEFAFAAELDFTGEKGSDLATAAVAVFGAVSVEFG